MASLSSRLAERTYTRPSSFMLALAASCMYNGVSVLDTGVQARYIIRKATMAARPAARAAAKQAEEPRQHSALTGCAHHTAEYMISVFCEVKLPRLVVNVHTHGVPVPARYHRYKGRAQRHVTEGHGDNIRT